MGSGEVSGSEQVCGGSVLLYPPQAASHAIGPPPDAEVLKDLHLEEVFEAVLKGRAEYDLRDFFYTPLRGPEVARYRQEVARDLEDDATRRAVGAFAERMERARSLLRGMTQVEGAHFKQAWFLDAADSYCDAVTSLKEELAARPLRARALLWFCDYLARYAASERFVKVRKELGHLQEELSSLRYSLFLKGTRVTVGRYGGWPDYSAEVKATFSRFCQADVKDFRATFRDQRDVNHVQAQVLERLGRQHPELFGRLAAFYAQRDSLVDATVATFDREVQFYLAYSEFAGRLEQAGLKFCYPEICEPRDGLVLEASFDIALAAKLAPTGSAVVTNNLILSGPERIVVVTGPNSGGKTTFARMVGQVHYLASLGLPVPGRSARLALADRIFTHFEREERLETLSGKLEGELLHAYAIVSQATERSVVVMNESFASTTLADSLFIGSKVIELLARTGALVVYVTFVDELAAQGEATVSMVAEVSPEDPDVRTFKLTRRAADGRAYALALARKHRLTYECLRERVLG